MEDENPILPEVDYQPNRPAEFILEKKVPPSYGSAVKEPQETIQINRRQAEAAETHPWKVSVREGESDFEATVVQDSRIYENYELTALTVIDLDADITVVDGDYLVIEGDTSTSPPTLTLTSEPSSSIEWYERNSSTPPEQTYFRTPIAKIGIDGDGVVTIEQIVTNHLVLYYRSVNIELSSVTKSVVALQSRPI